MAELDPKVLYHRTLGNAFAKLPYIDYAARREVFENAAKKTGITLGTAHTIRNRKLVPVLYELKKDQDFKTYATGWEILHSKLPFGAGSGKAEPVVDENMTVVAHLGWYEASSVFVPQNAWRVARKDWVMKRANTGNMTPILQLMERSRNLEEMLADGVEMHADDYRRYYLKQGYGAINSPQTLFGFVTDPEGRALFCIGSRDLDALESSWVTPLDLLSIAKLVMLAATLVGAVAIRMLTRAVMSRALRGASREIASRELGSGAVREGADDAARLLAAGVARESGSVTLRRFTRRAGRMTVDEMEAYLKELLANRPDLRRLMAARVMTGQGRMDAIQIALREFENTQGWRVVEKSTAEMEAAGIARDNIVSMKSELRQLWINNERAARWDPSDFYDHVVHDLSAHALVGRGGTLGGAELPFIGETFTRINNGMFILENAIKKGDLGEVLAFFRR